MGVLSMGGNAIGLAGEERGRTGLVNRGLDVMPAADIPHGHVIPARPKIRTPSAGTILVTTGSARHRRMSCGRLPASRGSIRGVGTREPGKRKPPSAPSPRVSEALATGLSVFLDRYTHLRVTASLDIRYDVCIGPNRPPLEPPVPRANSLTRGIKMPPPPPVLAQRDAEDACAIRDSSGLAMDCDKQLDSIDRRRQEAHSIDDPEERAAYLAETLRQRDHVVETRKRAMALMYRTIQNVRNRPLATRVSALMARMPRIARATRSTRHATARRCAGFASAGKAGDSSSGDKPPGDGRRVEPLTAPQVVAA